jgi:hypothetical protein
MKLRVEEFLFLFLGKFFGRVEGLLRNRNCVFCGFSGLCMSLREI